MSEFMLDFLKILISGGLFSLIQFFITFGFSRSDKTNEIAKKVDRLDAKVDKNQAILARTHILRFNDEIKNGIHHSSEYWRQTLDDCDTYNEFCEEHKDFKNSYTVLADKNIKETFERLSKEGKI